MFLQVNSQQFVISWYNTGSQNWLLPNHEFFFNIQLPKADEEDYICFNYSKTNPIANIASTKSIPYTIKVKMIISRRSKSTVGSWSRQTEEKRSQKEWKKEDRQQLTFVSKGSRTVTTLTWQGSKPISSLASRKAVATSSSSPSSTFPPGSATSPAKRSTPNIWIAIITILKGQKSQMDDNGKKLK